jgi:hypothetical protein
LEPVLSRMSPTRPMIKLEMEPPQLLSWQELSMNKALKKFRPVLILPTSREELTKPSTLFPNNSKINPPKSKENSLFLMLPPSQQMEIGKLVTCWLIFMRKLESMGPSLFKKEKLFTIRLNSSTD